MAPTLRLPPTFVLPTHLDEDERLKIEDKIPSLTYDITEAKLILGKVGTVKRAEFELRSRGVQTVKVEKQEVKRQESDDDVVEAKRENGNGVATKAGIKHGRDEKVSGGVVEKRKLGQIGGRKKEVKVETAADEEKRESDEKKIAQEKAIVIDDSSTESEDEPATPPTRSRSIKSETPALKQDSVQELLQESRQATQKSQVTTVDSSTDSSNESDADIDWDTGTVRMVKLAWFEACLSKGRLLPLEPYLVYEGIPKPSSSQLPSHPHPRRSATPASNDILERARADPPPKAPYVPYGTGGAKFAPEKHNRTVTRPTHLLHETTSEHDNPANLPPLPDWLHTTYSCQRPTPLHPPNEEFVNQLKKIRQSRVLTDDEIGVRAYSSAIASIAAYPYEIKSRLEILRLPVCSEKIAALWAEWREFGDLEVVREIEKDEDLRILQLFYDIWGVGAKGARDFYYKRGWRDLDDVVEYGWSTLSRVQQIGVKYYEEFLDPIPRDEVEAIGATILKAANAAAPGCQMTIAGGHRRGKESSGDVDVVVSHPDEGTTSFLVTRIVEVLEKQGWITHTLLLSTANSERNQTPVSYKGENIGAHSGFDTLDKALVVWQDPFWPARDADLEANPKAKNPNVHRRVDIILSPWKTVGCATAGWTSGTTFQRDLRRWAKTKGLKFDSSGVRSREDGRWMDFEGVGGKCTSMLEAEKKVFRGLELEWREPVERCTG